MEIRTLPTEEYFRLVRLSLEANGEAFVRVTGDSMRPMLRHMRDGVILVPAGRIRVGDVVLYDRRNGHYALHRVIRLQGSTFTMMGDAQYYLDRGLFPEQIVGRVSCIVRDGRRIPAESLFPRCCAVRALILAYPKALFSALKTVVRRIIGRTVRRFP